MISWKKLSASLLVFWSVFNFFVYISASLEYSSNFGPFVVPPGRSLGISSSVLLIDGQFYRSMITAAQLAEYFSGGFLENFVSGKGEIEKEVLSHLRE